MLPATSLCLVHKHIPRVVSETVSASQREALRDFFDRGYESQALLTFLNRIHDTRQWIVCDCLDPSTPLVERPALTVARSPKDKLYLRNLISRRDHAEHCPFRYVPGPQRERGEAAPEEDQRSIMQGALNLHRATAKGMSEAAAPNADQRQSRTKSRQYPRLGQVLLHLMTQAGMLDQGPKFDFLESIRDLRLAAGGLQAFAGTQLSEVLCLSAKQQDELVRRVDELRRVVANAYGLMIIIVHEIDKSPMTLIRRDKSGNVEWMCAPRGEVKIWARRSISKGPFIAAITFAPAAGQTEVCAQHAFVLPIVGKSRPMPVESDLERQAASSLIRLAEWAGEQKKMRIDISKPMYDIDVDNGRCRPDFIVRGPGGQVVVEVMGMLDDEEYRDRKEHTHPLMRNIGELIEIGPAVSQDDLRAMNKSVLKGVGWKLRARSSTG